MTKSAGLWLKSGGCYLRMDQSRPADHISLALIGMGEDPSSGQWRRWRWPNGSAVFHNCTQEPSKDRANASWWGRSGQACMSCKERTNAGVISFLPAQAFWQMAAWQRVRMRPLLVNFFKSFHSPLLPFYLFVPLTLSLFLSPWIRFGLTRWTFSLWEAAEIDGSPCDDGCYCEMTMIARGKWQWARNKIYAARKWGVVRVWERLSSRLQAANRQLTKNNTTCTTHVQSLQNTTYSTRWQSYPFQIWTS